MLSLAEGYRRCAVIGSPIAHSLSPVMHRAAYVELGLNWDYSAIEVKAGGVAELIADLSTTWRGLSVTMPLKPELLAVPGAQVSADARLAQAGNTVVLIDPADDPGRGAPTGHSTGSRRTVLIDNTDIGGFTAALQRRCPDRRFSEALVLGTGASARSAMIGLIRHGVERIVVTGRSATKAQQLIDLAAPGSNTVITAQPWSAPVSPTTDLVISTLPGGVLSPEQASRFVGAPVIFDISYHPWPSALASAASRGQTVLDGLDLLADQAALQVRLMTGRPVATEILLDAARAELRARTS